jgi:excisionase family DNA binding protein
VKENPTPQFIKMPETAKRVGIGYNTFRHGVETRIIPFYRSGKMKLFKLDEVEAAILANRKATTARC